MRELLTSRLARSRTLVESGDRTCRGEVEHASDTGSKETLTRAAALVPLIDHPSGMTVLLTERTKHLHDHAGQISFPGGRVESRDDSPKATALRETEEEIGLAPRFIEVIGYPDLCETGTGFLVTPVVGLISPGFTLSPDEFEVADIFEVPLSFVLDTRNHRQETRYVGGRHRSYYVIEYEDRYIWGATAGMLINLYEKLRSSE